MPTPYLKKLASETGRSLASLEKLWDTAKEEAAKQGHKEDYAYITGILNRMVKASTSIQAKSRLQARLGASSETEKVTLTIEATPDAMKRLLNLLGAIQYNTGVGHSCSMGAFFDGDGPDKVWVEGLPDENKKLGADMASACSERSDGLVALIDTTSAVAYDARYQGEGNEGRVLVTSPAYPPK